LEDFRVGVVLDHERGPVSSGVTTALSDAVDALARAGAMVVEVHGEHLKIDAPAGMLTEEDRAALMEFKPKLLKFLSHTYEEPQEGPERARAWPAGQGLVQIRDPFTGEWHELPAAKSLPGVLAGADRRRKGGAG
jgi:Asp-tRNA(Asn)/Glu-tRNA(Gln) amidotransferase A subunit family amidase